jgi:chloramphenicol O-acetyltransferase type B
MTQDELQKWIARNLTIGPGSYKASPLEFMFERDGGTVGIGRFTSIGRNCHLYCGGEHHVEWVSTSPIREDRQSTYCKGPIEIGSDVWIGDDVTIMAGVTVGHGAVIGAWSVVDKDVAPYSIVAGNRAVFRRWRFTTEQIAALLDIAWWDWPEMTVRSRQLELCCPDVDAFIEKYRGKGVPPEALA